MKNLVVRTHPSGIKEALQLEKSLKRKLALNEQVVDIDGVHTATLTIKADDWGYDEPVVYVTVHPNRDLIGLRLRICNRNLYRALSLYADTPTQFTLPMSIQGGGRGYSVNIEDG